MTLPLASAHLVAFGAPLRAGGFIATPDQGIQFLRAVQVLGPRDMGDLRRAAHAIYGPGPDRQGAFDALFEAHFLGRVQPVLAPADEDDPEIQDDHGQDFDPVTPEEANEAGQEASTARIAGARRLLPSEDAALRALQRAGASALPHRAGRRRRRAKSGDRIDLRRVMRRAVAQDGEVLTLPRLGRKPVPRPVLVLVDVSGSMKEQTQGYFRLAHGLARLHDRVEVFALGTDLTRVTGALRVRHRAQALARVSDLVPDWDGGTRLGDTLEALLAVPRLAGMARGALVLTLSDGLERGDPASLQRAATRLGRLAWRHIWLTPLADGPGFTPQTQALAAIAPDIDVFASAASPATVVEAILTLARAPSTNGVSPR